MIAIIDWILFNTVQGDGAALFGWLVLPAILLDIIVDPFIIYGLVCYFSYLSNEREDNSFIENIDDKENEDGE